MGSWIVEFHPPSHFLEEIVSISFFSIRCATFPNAFISLGFHPFVQLPQGNGQTFLDFSPLCNFLREQGQFVSWIYIHFATSINIFPWETKLHFLEKCGQLLHIFILYAASWEHLLHFSNAFIKGIIGQIASNVVLGEVTPFFSYFCSLCNFLKSFPWRSKPSSFVAFLSKVGPTSLKLHPFHNFYIHFPNEGW